MLIVATFMAISIYSYWRANKVMFWWHYHRMRWKQVYLKASHLILISIRICLTVWLASHLVHKKFTDKKEKNEYFTILRIRYTVIFLLWTLWFPFILFGFFFATMIYYIYFNSLWSASVLIFIFSSSLKYTEWMK